MPARVSVLSPAALLLVLLGKEKAVKTPHFIWDLYVYGSA